MTCVTRALATLLAALLLSGLAALQPVAAGAATAAADTYAQSALGVTNEVRETRDRVRLQHNRCLQKYANKQARKLAKSETLAHQDLEPILEDCDMNLVGENLAMGYASGRKAVKQGWMKSQGHRANILERRYRRMAIAARKTDAGDWVAVQIFGRKA